VDTIIISTSLDMFIGILDVECKCLKCEIELVDVDGCKRALEIGF
jgi:hypothetical protein